MLSWRFLGVCSRHDLFIHCSPIEESCETPLHDTAIITLPSLRFPLPSHYFLTDTYKVLNHHRKRRSWWLLRSHPAFMSLVFIWAAHSLQCSLKLSWDVSSYSAAEEVAKTNFLHLLQKKKSSASFITPSTLFGLNWGKNWEGEVDGWITYRVLVRFGLLEWWWGMQNLAHMQAEEDWVPVLDQAAAVVLENSIKIGLRE